jgi:hypothetical protein
MTAAGPTTYEEVLPRGKVRPLCSSQRSHHQQQKQQTQPTPPPMPQQSSSLFQHSSSSPQQQQQLILCSSAQYQAFNMSDLGSPSSPSHSPPSNPPPPPQLPSYTLSQSYKQPYHRTNPQQQAGFPSFRLSSSPVAASHSPTPASEPPNLRQSVTSPTLKSPSFRSNSLPGLQDDTFVMPKVSTVIVCVWSACFCDSYPVPVFVTVILCRMLWATGMHL